VGKYTFFVQYEVVLRPSAAMLKVVLEQGEEITVAPGTWTYARGNWKVKTHSVSGALTAKLFGMATFWYNTFYAVDGKLELGFAPKIMGDVETVNLDGVCFVSERAFLALYGDAKLGVTWMGLRGWFASRKFIWLTVSGEGNLWIASCGGIIKMPSEGNLSVDTDDVVAVCSTTSNVEMNIKAFGGLLSKSFIFGGEGFYLTFPPDLDVYVQTRPLSTCTKMQRVYSRSNK